jgi:hypothetical protein
MVNLFSCATKSSHSACPDRPWVPHGRSFQPVRFAWACVEKAYDDRPRILANGGKWDALISSGLSRLSDQLHTASFSTQLGPNAFRHLYVKFCGTMARVRAAAHREPTHPNIALYEINDPSRQSTGGGRKPNERKHESIIQRTHSIPSMRTLE